MFFTFRLYLGSIQIIYICFQILASLVLFTNTCLPDLQYENHLLGSAFKIIEHSSLCACAAECASHGLCKSFQFQSGPRACRLNDLQYVEDGEKEAELIHSSITNWNKPIYPVSTARIVNVSIRGDRLTAKTRLGPCQNTHCGITERCSVIRNGTVQCEAFLPNISKDKPATASSIWPGDAFPPGTAVDGNVDPLWASKSCFATDNGDFSPWWQVDLQHTYVIVDVQITSRSALPERLHDFSIDVYRSNPTRTPLVSPQLCYMYKGAVTEPGRTVAVQCTSRVTGRYVRLSGKKTIDRQDVFQFCEVQVFGFKPLR